MPDYARDMIASCEHVTPGDYCPRCAPNVPDGRPSTVRGLLRSLWLEGAPIDDQRLHIRHLWDDPEYRPLLEPLVAQLREQGLL